MSKLALNRPRKNGIRIQPENHRFPLERLLDVLRSKGLQAEHRTPFDESYLFASREEQAPA